MRIAVESCGGALFYIFIANRLLRVSKTDPLKVNLVGIMPSSTNQAAFGDNLVNARFPRRVAIAPRTYAFSTPLSQALISSL